MSNTYYENNPFSWVGVTEGHEGYYENNLIVGHRLWRDGHGVTPEAMTYTPFSSFVVPLRHDA